MIPAVLHYVEACNDWLGLYLRGLAHELHRSEETSPRRRAIDDPAFDLTGPEIEPQPPATLAVILLLRPPAG